MLEQLHEHLRSRDLGFERVVERQGTRFTSILAVATLLAVAALTGVGILGYLFVNRGALLTAAARATFKRNLCEGSPLLDAGEILRFFACRRGRFTTEAQRHGGAPLLPRRDAN